MYFLIFFDLLGLRSYFVYSQNFAFQVVYSYILLEISMRKIFKEKTDFLFFKVTKFKKKTTTANILTIKTQANIEPTSFLNILKMERTEQTRLNY